MTFFKECVHACIGILKTAVGCVIVGLGILVMVPPFVAVAAIVFRLVYAMAAAEAEYSSWSTTILPMLPIMAIGFLIVRLEFRLVCRGIDRLCLLGQKLGAWNAKKLILTHDPRFSPAY